MIDSILSLCAQVEGNSAQYRLLSSALFAFNQWDDLIHQAEFQGISPLVFKHLTEVDVLIPAHAMRILKGLYFRHQRANKIRTNALCYILSAFKKTGIEVLLLKGAALCHTIYPDLGYRPMRDLDILVRKSEQKRAQSILLELGYEISTGHVIPGDHFHLEPVKQTINGLSVCIEVHHNLFPPLPRYQPLALEDLIESSVPVDLNGFTGYTLGNEDMLWHLYLHGFSMPLVYVPSRLVSVADIISLIEKNIDHIDWERIKQKYPRFLKILPLLHFLTPWPESIIKKLGIRIGRTPRGVGKTFNGWPRRHLRETRNKSTLKILKDTFFPPEWWLLMYYGVEGFYSRCRCRWIEHPLHVFWWVRLYRSIFIEFHLPRLHALLYPKK